MVWNLIGRIFGGRDPQEVRQPPGPPWQNPQQPAIPPEAESPDAYDSAEEDDREIYDSGSIEIDGGVYVDFDLNAEDNTDAEGRSFPGLRSQLLELRSRHSGALFPDLPPHQDILDFFKEAFFPNGMPQNLLVSNLSLQKEQPYLAIRPKVIGPRLEGLLPRGMTLAVCGRLWDSQRNPDNPVLRAQRVIDLSHSESRAFEREITAFLFTNRELVYPGSKRKDNALTTEFVSSLPQISILTGERLQDWRAYLDWKLRLIKARQAGLRYVHVDLESGGLYQFLVVAESKESFDRARRIFRNEELRAFGLRHSLDPWVFQYNENHRGRDTELGDFAGVEALETLPPEVDTEGMPWKRPFCARVFFRLSEDAQNELDARRESGARPEEIRSYFLGLVPSSGFLALSIVGDMTVVVRQRRELEMLQRQSGYAPFLSSYLFDIKAANEPRALAEIKDDQWFRRDLNEDQKLAVRKMISAPDLALVQGPPGTGKTTMIAEAVWQFTRQGKKVLVVSQANLAVDNALERLAGAPALRAVRLGRKAEGDHPFSQQLAISTYYGSIAARCRELTLDAWERAGRRHADLSKWLASADLLCHDLSALRASEEALQSEISSTREEIEKLAAQDEEARRTDRQRTDAEGFLAFLDQEREWSGQLPENLLRLYFDAVVGPVRKLESAGIILNRVWLEYEYGQPADRAAFAAEILREWRALLASLPYLESDLTRLQASDSETVLTAADELRLGELQRRLHEVQQAMVDDDSRLPEWQAIRKEIRELRRHGSGLDAAVYQRFFSGSMDGKPAWALFADPQASRVQVIEKLERAVRLIHCVREEISSGLSECRREIQRCLGALVVRPSEPDARQRLEGRLRLLAEKLREVTDQRQEKESRLLDLIKELGDGLPAKDGLDSARFPEIRAAVAKELDSLKTQIEESGAFREAWEPVLRRWVSDLADPETLRADAENFLPIYIRSCSVVGVTCTESRRTLEDAGHVWFDVVIVDEVSKATPPEIVMPLLLGRTAILVGDHRQLPPLFRESEGSWEELLVEQEENSGDDEPPDPSSELTPENFERFRRMVTSSLFKEHFENAPVSLKSFLFTQYRMHPQIMRIVNQFYENRLVCGLPDPDAKRPGSDPGGHRLHGMTLAGVNGSNYLTPEQHVLWLDSTTDPLGETHFEQTAGSGSKVNRLEAALIAKCLHDIEHACRAQGYGKEGKGPKRVGVITFYGRQVRAIREAVRRIQRIRNFQFTAIRYDINTVDRYQGQERPVVLVSMVRNPPRRLSPRANTAQFERINVAFSRAQELLIVTGSQSVFCRYPVDLPNLDRPGRKRVEVYRYIIGEIQRAGGLWNSDLIISPDDFAQLVPHSSAPATSPGKNRGGAMKP